MELMQASRQWATRPEDERFTSLQELHDKATYYRNQSREREQVALKSIRTEAKDGEVELVGKGGVGARLTNWAFGQIARFASAPADYLRTLPATLAVQNVNHGLARRVAEVADKTVSLLFHENGAYTLKAFTSDRYSRIWNNEVTERLLAMAERGWIPARPTMEHFVASGKDAAGRDLEHSAALYLSDHDLFAFVMHPDRIIKEPGNERGLMRGLIASNSEVGASKLRLLRFLFRDVCGNHIIWGAQDVIEVDLVHVGNVRDRFSLWSAKIQEYLNESANEDEARIRQAKTKLIAGTKEEVLDALFGKKSLHLSRKTLLAGYEAAQPDIDGDPRTSWGVAQGLTRYSQTVPYADVRTDIDTAAGRIIDMF